MEKAPSRAFSWLKVQSAYLRDLNSVSLPGVNTCLEECLNFNHEKALVWTFFVIVKTDGSFAALHISSMAVYMVSPVHRVVTVRCIQYISLSPSSHLSRVCGAAWPATGGLRLNGGLMLPRPQPATLGNNRGAAGTLVTYHIFNFSNLVSNIYSDIQVQI